MEEIIIKGAKQNNLKNVSLTLPRNKLIVFTGLSGSGKSSLAFDTIFAEGQRRYVESLSSYARQFLGQMDKPDVETIEGLSPAISIDQKTTSKNPRSTVGTVTEIYDYLRLLYARIGIPHCPKCGREIQSVSIDQIVDKVMLMPEKTHFSILAPVVRDRKGEYTKLLDGFRRSGYSRVRIDGSMYLLDEPIEMDKNLRHNIAIVVDRLIMKADVRRRLTDSLEAALKVADGLVVVESEGKEELFSTNYACPDCDVSIGEITPRMFSFNAPYGACERCSGLGYTAEIDIQKLIPDPNVSIEDNAIKCSGWNLDMGQMAKMKFRALAQKYKFSLKVPFQGLPKEVQDIILYGTSDRITLKSTTRNFKMEMNAQYEGVIPNLMRRYRETQSEAVHAEIEKLMSERECTVCHGQKLKKEVLAITVGGKNIHEICCLPVTELPDFFASLTLSEKESIIAKPILKELFARVRFLIDVGLGYLTLGRCAATLSGGEAQRIRLATQIGSGLTGVLYILDEPSIGLHQRDNDRLLGTLKKLRDLGNTLIVVEHDEDTIRCADHIVDIGPGAGVLGGEIVAEGTVADIENCPRSVTGQYLSGRCKIVPPTTHRLGNGHILTVKGARQHNLKGIDVSFPLGKLIVVTGVSGSGKSSLVNGILYPHLANVLNKAELTEGDYDGMEGLEFLDKVINIDQSPIGRTPRSNPATYTGVFTAIRELFAKTQGAKARGYDAGRFSFNVKGGRCENCSGDGIIKIEMNFLSDVYVPCEVCRGKRYNHETLEVKYKDKSIFDVLDMTVDEACRFFENVPAIYNKVNTLREVGLGYIKLGQPATTFSGGEAQRIKLATELSKRPTDKTIYILDEPTTGLHVADVEKLMNILNRLVDKGNTVVVIEHNLDVIRMADHLIDLGPEGGGEGGRVIVIGTPEEVKASRKGYTSQYI